MARTGRLRAAAAGLALALALSGPASAADAAKGLTPAGAPGPAADPAPGLAANLTPDCQARPSRHWQGIVPGVWVWPGAAEDIQPGNQGHVATQVLIAQGRRATLIDPGPGLAHGREVWRSARCELGLEIDRVLNSHAHAENVLGNAAFGPTAGHAAIEASATTRQSMALRCESCRAAIAEAAADPGLARTPILLPAPVLQDGQRWSSDSGDWLTLEFRSAHSESDLAWWNAREQLLVAPSLLYQDRLPELAQGSLQGWIAALQALDRLQPVRLVGNRPMPRAGLAATLDYLCGLERQVLQALESGLSAAEALRIGQPARPPLAEPAARHDFNLQRAWRELEPRWIQGLPATCPAPD